MESRLSNQARPRIKYLPPMPVSAEDGFFAFQDQRPLQPNTEPTFFRPERQSLARPEEATSEHSQSTAS